MNQRIDLGTIKKRANDFIRDLSPIRFPIELMLDGKVVARLMPPSALSDEEKERLVDEARQLMEEARANAKAQGFTDGDIGRAVDAAVKRVRSRSKKETERVLDEGWELVQKARRNVGDLPASVIQREVDKAVREVRARHGQRRR